MDVVVTAGAIIDVLSSSQTVTTNKPTSNFFAGRMPFLLSNQQCQSAEGEAKHWRGYVTAKGKGKGAYTWYSASS